MSRAILVPGPRAALAVASLLGVGALACASGSLGESHVWMRPCGTAEQRQVDRDACASEAVGLADPSSRAAEYTQDLFRQCMVSRGWQRLPSGTTLACQ